MKKLLTGMSLILAAMSSAFAAVPAVVGTTLTSVQTDGLAIIDLVWPVVIAIFGGLLLIKLFKKAASKI